MGRFFYGMSLKNRIWTASIILTVVCITTTGLMSYYIASRVTENNAFQLSQNTLNKSVQVLDERFKHIIVSSSTMMLSEPFKHMIRDVAERKADSYFQHLSALQSSFTQMQLNESSIESVFISTPIGDFYSTNTSLSPGLRFKDTSFYRTMLDEGPAAWVGGHEDMLFTGRNRVLSLLLKPFMESSASDVYMVVNVNEEKIKQDLYQDINSNGVQFILLNGEGQEAAVISPLPEALRDDPTFYASMEGQKAGHFEYKIDQMKKSRMLVNYSHLRLVEDWTLVSLQAKSDLLSQITLIKWLIVIIMVVCVVIAFLFSKLLSSLLLRPLYKLQALMGKVELDNRLDVRFESQFDDEVTQVGDSFNRMLEQLTTLIADLKSSEQEKRKSEIKALQAQIDPHFLYNTLNTILWKSETAEQQDVREMIISLSRLFQLGLNNGSEITTLDKELEHVKQYMDIQQKCYEGLFTYIIEVKDKELYKLPLVKILLQPLVENSILHGFSHLEGGGFIHIHVEREGLFLKLSVEDNGCGMNAEEIYRNMTQSPEKKTSYALSNVHSRLQLYYGMDAYMELTSTPEEQTEVKLMIPIAAL